MGRIDFSVQDGIAVVVLDNPAKRNAVDAEMRAGLTEAYTRIQEDDDIRVAVIRGAGDKAFSSGGDIDAYQENSSFGPEGSGPPPHTHPWDESFYVTKGRIDFGIGPEKMTALAGTLVHLPAGTVHWFRFGQGGGEMISMTSRLGASKLFADLAREIAPVNPDVGRLAAVGARHGLEVAR